MTRRRELDADIDEAVDSVKKSAGASPSKIGQPDFKRMLSTGSTLLDLAISGGRVHGGGVPAGILLEIYGKSSSGKTSILSELCGSAQSKGGDVIYLDPEARFDKEYSRIYGVELRKENYYKPDTVSGMFDIIAKWKPTDPSAINIIAADSLAALSTDLEMEKGDKMGMRRAKEFSEGLRKYCRQLEGNGWILACSNQVRQGDYGDVTPGGKAVEFYASLRISINRVDKIVREKAIEGGSKVKRVIGIESKCEITKSSVDKPFRVVPIYIIFDYGIDDIRANLQWLKDVLGDTTYDAIDKSYQNLDRAVIHIEDNDLEKELREKVINIWAEIEEKFNQQRKRKSR